MMKKALKLVVGVIMAICVGVITGSAVYAAETSESVDISIERGCELYQSFLDITAIMKSDSSWDELMKSYENGGENKGFYDEAFVDSVADATISQYEELSAYDTFIYAVTYLKMAKSLDQQVFNYYIEMGAEGVETQVNLYTNHWKGNDCEIIKVAYQRLVEWQFAYIRENGYPYNFVTNKSYAEETGLVTEPSKEVSEESKEIADEGIITEEKIEHIQESADAMKDVVSEETQEVAQDTKEEASAEEPASEKSNVVLPVILVVILAGAAYTIFQVSKKKKNK